jgi:hypothetical protein
MSRNIPGPVFPVPPKEYDQRYMSELTRVFALYQQQIQNPGEGRNTTIVLTNIPYVGTAGLQVGTICVDPNGFLKVVQAANIATVTGVAATGGVGQITKAP